MVDNTFLASRGRGRHQGYGVGIQIENRIGTRTRDEEGVTADQIDPIAGCLYRPGSKGNCDDRKFGSREWEWAGTFAFQQLESVAIDQQRLPWYSCLPRNCKRNGSSIKVDHLEGLIDVEWTRLTVRIDSVPVEEPEGAIARLLNLRDDQSCAERVNCSRRNEDAIALPRLQCMKAGFCRSLFDSAPEVGPCDPRLETGVEEGSRVCFDDVPCLCLSAVWDGHLSPIDVVWMDLNAQYALAVEVLQKQGEAI